VRARERSGLCEENNGEQLLGVVAKAAANAAARSFVLSRPPKKRVSFSFTFCKNMGVTDADLGLY
jgi:hypothetical protein